MPNRTITVAAPENEVHRVFRAADPAVKPFPSAWITADSWTDSLGEKVTISLTSLPDEIEPAEKAIREAVTAATGYVTYSDEEMDVRYDEAWARNPVF